MPPVDPRIRQIKIQTGVVTRITKEKKMYEKENVEMDKKVEQLKAEGKDSYVINKQIECAAESKAMVPDCVRRLKDGCDKLKNLLEVEKDLAETEEYKNAQLALESAASEIN
ncbi:tubulin-specific chaperone A-like [Tubulanus polymorphus]|uniref:tubulin-specific chaperone A-like n=1 Tax=Tubulanus polymorphus TaxID=672921 RepID=UPI003DA2BCB4